MDENKEFKALHSLNRLRVPTILKIANSQNLNGKNILEVGSGGGILSFSLARLGASVTGVDACKESVTSATNSAQKILNDNIRKRVNFIHNTIEEFSKEVIEHVPNVEDFVTKCSGLLKNNGSIFFSTINKTFLSKILAIEMAENIIGIVPEGVHDWEKFVDPNYLTDILYKNNIKTTLCNGVAYNPLTNDWFWINNTNINYFLIGKKALA
ncbi:Hexaprenyldihydroxybenzoate methyltransferase, mitochondrial [Strongyloides ratti]|uniref:Hexaprenyldihydroxybenzoate methyltransferase, mitochondrial n=1 Tax=Strongyloides ratti TaxID=34506 RepID=A0A090L8Q7_STRRB|nr:Hexaprenyldihydroxybenzoate methyltransferase, mitochondrial [Strongyloides ratti]CEF64523.1 Hexaprenyldihydroxybenzoate methyltransferase, mitochondrial [Strongyloides ratti]